MSLFSAGELDQMAFKGPFQLKHFYDSMILYTYYASDFTTDPLFLPSSKFYYNFSSAFHGR